MYYCPYCGAPLSIGAKRCLNCGVSIPENETNNGRGAIISPPNAAPNPVIVQQTAYSQGASPAPPKANPTPSSAMNVCAAEPESSGCDEISTKKWVGIFLLLSLGGALTCGILPIVLLVVWSFAGEKSKTLRRFSRAALIVSLAELALVAVIVLIAGLMISCSAANPVPDLIISM